MTREEFEVRKNRIVKEKNICIFLVVVSNLIYLVPLIVVITFRITGDSRFQGWVEWTISIVCAFVYAVVIVLEIKEEQKRYRQRIKIVEEEE